MQQLLSAHHRRLASSYSKSNRQQETAAIFQQAVALQPTDGLSYLSLGTLLRAAASVLMLLLAGGFE